MTSMTGSLINQNRPILRNYKGTVYAIAMFVRDYCVKYKSDGLSTRFFSLTSIIWKWKASLITVTNEWTGNTPIIGKVTGNSPVDSNRPFDWVQLLNCATGPMTLFYYKMEEKLMKWDKVLLMGREPLNVWKPQRPNTKVCFCIRETMEFGLPK